MDIAAPEHVVISSEDDTLSTAFPLPAVHHMGSVSNSTRSTFSQDWESVYRLDDHNPDSMYTTASSTLAMPNSRPPSNTNELPLPVSRTNPSYSGSDPTSDVVYNTSYPPRSSVQFNPSDSSALSRTSHPSTTYVPGFASSPGTATAQDYRGPGSHIVSYGHPPASFDHAFSSSARTVNTPNPPSNINRPPLPIFDYNLSYYGLPPGVGYGSYAPRLSNQFTPLYPSSLSYSFHSSVPQTPSFASSPVTAPARSHPGPRSHSAGGKSRVSIIDETPVGSWTTSFSGGPSSQIDHISRPSARKRFGAVKCDLVEKASQEGGEASCTACIDRGINCVAYPQFPKPKAHRRSKKAINVEAIAGKKNHGKEAGSGGPGAPEPLSTSGKAHLSLIPSTIAADDLAWGTTGNTNPHHDLDAISSWRFHG
ncbi:hypothetical protein DL93DRAFT_2103134 [Clavulina sp. PMI_390]|nr:hypothetical protein DL93DRAFT_2103134 [Clavulina sp. PMI_390]